MISMNLQKKMRKEEDCLKACIKRQMITSNAKEGGNVYQILSRVLDIASSAKSDVIILGAFGCGAFANPPELVAKAMHAAIDEHKYDFETIELAIYCSSRDTLNYEVFAKEFAV